LRNSILSKISLVLRFIFFSPITILIILVYPFYKIKIFEIESRLIGHFSHPVEIFLCEIDQGIHNKEREIYLWVPNKLISNNFLLKKWKEVMVIVPEFIFYPIFYFFKYFNLSHFLIPYRHWSTHHKALIQAVDLHNVLVKSRPKIILKPHEINQGKVFLKKQNFSENDKFVCFFARDPYYHPNIKNGLYKNSLRDSSILTQIPAMEHLSKNKYKIFRVGSTFGEKLPFINDKVIDYAHSNFKSDFLDIFLLMQCEFMVSTGSGIDSVPLLNRKKVLLVNYSHPLETIDNFFYPLFITKKYKSLPSGDLIPYSQVFEKKLYLIQNISELERNGYRLVDNSELEILEAVVDMEKHINNDYHQTNDLKYLRKKFSDIYFRFFNYRIKNINMCESFIIRNQSLIN
jgi:putative glycosyltransferase (TIGR04372 family)